jgi:hypothetical protein
MELLNMRRKKGRAEMCSDTTIMGARYQSDFSMPLSEFMYIDRDLLEANQG